MWCYCTRSAGVTKDAEEAQRMTADDEWRVMENDEARRRVTKNAGQRLAKDGKEC